MENEACPHYEEIINNIMIDHAFLKEKFGITSRIE
jgi:hypothetical protein